MFLGLKGPIDHSKTLMLSHWAKYVLDAVCGAETKQNFLKHDLMDYIGYSFCHHCQFSMNSGSPGVLSSISQSFLAGMKSMKSGKS